MLGGLTPEVLIAAGESQSASRLVTYVNAIHPLANVYDGFMVHSRGAGGSPLTQAPLPTISVPSPAQIRNDLADPVMVVQAEGDVINSIGVRQPDTPKFRVWELAGTSHSDAYTLTVSAIDVGDGSGAVRRCSTACATHPMSDARTRSTPDRTTGSSRRRIHAPRHLGAYRDRSRRRANRSSWRPPARRSSRATRSATRSAASARRTSTFRSPR